MAGVKKLTSYFKKLTKDEMEVEALLATQLSRNSKTASIESSKTLSTLSSAVMSAIDLRAFLVFIYGAHIWELPYMGPKCSPPKTFLLFICGSNIWLCVSHIFFFLYRKGPFPFAYIFVFGSRFLSYFTF
jgi:hypothetical protein